MTNALKHAGAGWVKMEVVYTDEKFVLRVSDNGQGFDPSGIGAPAVGHFGLLGMRERANKMEAGSRVRSAPGHGTQIEVIVPIQKHRAGRAGNQPGRAPGPGPV